MLALYQSARSSIVFELELTLEVLTLIFGKHNLTQTLTSYTLFIAYKEAFVLMLQFIFIVKGEIILDFQKYIIALQSQRKRKLKHVDVLMLAVIRIQKAFRRFLQWVKYEDIEEEKSIKLDK